MTSNDSPEYWRAVHVLHAAQAFPRPSAEFQAAEKGLHELLARTGGWDGYDGLKRDDLRLLKRYQRVMEEQEPDLIAHARSLGLLHTDKE